MALDPVTRKEHFLARVAGDSGAVLEPVTREEMFLQRIIDNGSGPGPSPTPTEVTPAEIVTATGQMNATQKAQTRANIEAAPEMLTVEVTDNNGTLSANKSYDQIAEAISANQTVIARFGLVGDDMHPYVFALSYDTSTPDVQGPIRFTTIDGGLSTHAIIMVLELSRDDQDPLTDVWTRKNFHVQTAPTTSNLGGSHVTITPIDNYIFKCGELASLTISNPPATGAYSIVFTSGSTATTTTIPSTILGLESFAPEANTLYEINVLDNRAVVGSWAVSA